MNKWDLGGEAVERFHRLIDRIKRKDEKSIRIIR